MRRHSKKIPGIILVVIDGLSDKALKSLRNKTPLGAARKPNLDFFVKRGVCGLARPFLLPRQKFPASDTCHLALLGFDPKVYYLGRGVYEAAGIGMQLKKGDVAFRANFATVGGKLRIVDRRAQRIKDTQALIRALSKIKIAGVRIIIKKSYGHRAVLVLRGKNLSADVSDSDPKKTGKTVKKVLPKTGGYRARFTARVLNEFLAKAHYVLKNHPLNRQRAEQGLLPANYLLVRGAGQFKKRPTLQKRYHLKAGCIAGGGLYRGIGKILGMDLIQVRGATGFANTNLAGKFLAARRALKKYDLVFLHIKAADSLAEDGNFLAKKRFIEKIDRSIKTLRHIKDAFIIVTADHSTCCNLKRHCLKPMPILIYGNGQSGNVSSFSEKACQRGSLATMSQLEIMPLVLKLAKNNSKGLRS